MRALEGEPDEHLLGDDAALWDACQAAHRGYQVGARAPADDSRVGIQSGFLEITSTTSSSPSSPSASSTRTAAKLARALAPPPKASSERDRDAHRADLLRTRSAAPPELIDEGDHFEEGQPLFIIEVMKMFNKVLAPFSGTVTKNLMAGSDGAVVKAGQAIFEIEPDEILVVESDAEIAARRKQVTEATLDA